jgi:hypothetical protein
LAITSSEARLLAKVSHRTVAEPVNAPAITRLDEDEAMQRGRALARRPALTPCPFLRPAAGGAHPDFGAPTAPSARHVRLRTAHARARRRPAGPRR